VADALSAALVIALPLTCAERAAIQPPGL